MSGSRYDWLNPLVCHTHPTHHNLHANFLLVSLTDSCLSHEAHRAMHDVTWATASWQSGARCASPGLLLGMSNYLIVSAPWGSSRTGGVAPGGHPGWTVWHGLIPRYPIQPVLVRVTTEHYEDGKYLLTLIV